MKKLKINYGQKIPPTKSMSLVITLLSQTWTVALALSALKPPTWAVSRQITPGPIPVGDKVMVSYMLSCNSQPPQIMGPWKRGHNATGWPTPMVFRRLNTYQLLEIRQPQPQLILENPPPPWWPQSMTDWAAWTAYIDMCLTTLRSAHARQLFKISCFVDCQQPAHSGCLNQNTLIDLQSLRGLTLVASNRCT